MLIRMLTVGASATHSPLYSDKSKVQTYLGAIAGSVPNHHSKGSHNLFAGGESCGLGKFIDIPSLTPVYSSIK